MHRTRNSILEQPQKKLRGRDNDENSNSDHHERRSKKRIRKRIEVMLSKLRHDGFRTKLRKVVHIFFIASIIMSVIMLVSNMIDQIPHNKRFGQIPRNMVQLVGEEDYSQVQFLSQMKFNWGLLKKIHDNGHKHSHGHEPFEEGSCKAMHQWQLEAYPTCNKLHETDMNKLRHVGQGGFRDVWAMKEWNGITIAVKTLGDRKKYTYREYDRHRRDAVAMSLLTSSKHIPNIYGYCTNSGMFDFSPDGSMDDHIFEQKKQWTKRQELQFSWQVTAALADVHGIGMRKDSSSISHTDISVDQFLWLDGMYKLNDFNRARFIRWDVRKNKPCTFYIPKSPGRNRSPEEYEYDQLTEKIDVYSLGNILYSILTKHEAFDEMKKTEAQDLVKHGKRPPIPDKLWEAEELAIIEAINMCWAQKPKNRPSARDVDSFLKGKLFELNVTMF